MRDGTQKTKKNLSQHPLPSPRLEPSTHDLKFRALPLSHSDRYGVSTVVDIIIIVMDLLKQLSYGAREPCG
jgi:hypothetical protein